MVAEQQGGGVPWKTVRWRASPAITGTDCTPDDPLPITPTRLPWKATGLSCGQWAVWYSSPSKSSIPGTSGRNAARGR